MRYKKRTQMILKHAHAHAHAPFVLTVERSKEHKNRGKEGGQENENVAEERSVLI